MGGYKAQVPQSIALRVLDDIREYKKKHDLSIDKLKVVLECTHTTATSWLSGKSSPRLSAIKTMIDKGVTDVELPEDLRQKAIESKLREADRGNRIPRTYRKRISIPDIVNNQLKLLIDDYVEGLSVPRTFDEFKDNRNEFIGKLFYTCKQGE